MGWLGSERPEPRAVYPRRYRVSVIGENADGLEYYLNSGNAAGWKLVEIIHVPDTGINSRPGKVWIVWDTVPEEVAND